MKDSGTYTFKKDDLFQQAAELTKPKEAAPLIVSGPLEELKNLDEGLSFTIAQCAQLNMALLATSLIRWQKACEQAINDEELEN